MKLINSINLKLFDLDEVAKELDVTKVFLRNEIKRGRLKACCLSKILYVSEDSLRDYLNGDISSIPSTQEEVKE